MDRRNFVQMIGAMAGASAAGLSSDAVASALVQAEVEPGYDPLISFQMKRIQDMGMWVEIPGFDQPVPRGWSAFVVEGVKPMSKVLSELAERSQSKFQWALTRFELFDDDA